MAAADMLRLPGALSAIEGVCLDWLANVDALQMRSLEDRTALTCQAEPG